MKTEEAIALASLIDGALIADDLGETFEPQVLEKDGDAELFVKFIDSSRTPCRVEMTSIGLLKVTTPYLVTELELSERYKLIQTILRDCRKAADLPVTTPTIRRELAEIAGKVAEELGVAPAHALPRLRSLIEEAEQAKEEVGRLQARIENQSRTIRSREDDAELLRGVLRAARGVLDVSRAFEDDDDFIDF